jgi:hypothetical protein
LSPKTVPKSALIEPLKKPHVDPKTPKNSAFPWLNSREQAISNANGITRKKQNKLET